MQECVTRTVLIIRSNPPPGMRPQPTYQTFARLIFRGSLTSPLIATPVRVREWKSARQIQEGPWRASATVIILVRKVRVASRGTFFRNIPRVKVPHHRRRWKNEHFFRQATCLLEKIGRNSIPHRERITLSESI